MLHVGKFVAGVFDLDISRTDAGNPRAADLAVAERVEQDGESREMQRMLWLDADQRDLILEFAQMVAG